MTRASLALAILVAHSAIAAPVPSLSAGECGRCHARELAEWRASGHASAATNALYRASFRRSPRRWCRSCHAPGGDQGVDCAACHVEGGVVLASRAPSPAALAAHPVRVAPLDEAAFCGGCHQFDFPARDGRAPVVFTDEPMQDTLAEWTRFGAPDVRCQDCHMGAAGHRMPGGHDAALIARTIAIEVALVDGGTRARVRLIARGAGHRVPTGDPFRRVIVRLCRAPDCDGADDPIATAGFGRSFRDRASSDEDPRWTLARDTTAPPPAVGASEASRVLEVALPTGASTIYWRADYRWAAPSTEADLAERDRGVEIARGIAR